MKKYIISLSLFAATLFCSQSLKAQGLAVNTTGVAANTSAMLDVASTTQGVLVPRMDSAQRTLIVSPATGLLVYQTDGVAPGFYYNSGSAGTPAWTSLSNLPNTTIQGNTFNGNSQLVQTTAAGKLPAIDGSALTNLNGANLQANSVTVGKLPSGSGSANAYLNGAGGWTTPSGGGQVLLETVTSLSATAPNSGAAGVVGSVSSLSTATIAESYEEQAFPVAGTLSNLQVRIVCGTANAYAATVTLYKNGTPTSITCTTTTSSGSILGTATGSDATHTVTIAAGDTIGYVISSGQSNNNNRITISLNFQ